MKVKLIAWSIGITSLMVSGLAGLVYVVNLPYPMIRRPVARIAPILLLPSYMEMDRNYREAIAHVEQADQLINSPSSFADITLGETKVQAAQTNLDALPVWFLGYEPKFYCSLFGCSWQFTFDEFQAARMKIGRMDAIVFQQKNAKEQYEKADKLLQTAKQDYQKAANLQQQQAVLIAWQNALDEIEQLPPSTFAATLAKAKLDAYQRDFQQVSGNIGGIVQTNTMIQAAQQFSLAAATTCQNPPHPVEKWQQCAKLWQEAIERLEKVQSDEPGYVEAQALLAQYQTNLGTVEVRLATEAESLNAFEKAQANIQQLQSIFAKGINPDQRNYFISELQGTIDQLQKVQPQTTAYSQAQELLKFADAKLKEVSS
ncbi:conserved hypothetical protein [Rippkaea orientalis PCC 8801]|uniref:Uncharacterized protein n=1 Tax=Rippkaea orientalis (strain PCC 8801 / RF-1) TaxID=41431 RepID=B7JZS3_RIPO1|nr:hypothetical protein [Rippkaea orientalis]ACK65016.1 conserved hypothetical protein [Rippkaea orientalis PCC 8801]